MTFVVYGLLLLAAISLGLRTTAIFIGPRTHPLIRLAVSIAVGTLIVLVTLEVCEGYQVFPMGLGLLLSLSPVGVFDLAKWWFRWRPA